MMTERLKVFLSSRKITFASLERKLGVANGTFGKAMKGGGSFATATLEKILKEFPDLSAEWLLREEGTMIREDVPLTTDAVKVQMLEEQVRQLTKEKENYWSLIVKLTEGKK